MLSIAESYLENTLNLKISRQGSVFHRLDRLNKQFQGQQALSFAMLTFKQLTGNDFNVWDNMDDLDGVETYPIEQIAKISFRNYRMFGHALTANLENSEFELAPLTLIAGANNSGKSAIVEAIDLLDRNYRAGNLPGEGIALDVDETDIIGDRLENSWGVSLLARHSDEQYYWKFLAQPPSKSLCPPVSGAFGPERFPFSVSLLSGLKQPIRVAELLDLEILVPGSVLLLQIPEHNLDGDAQSELGRRIARSVDRGVQVVVETHSDHLLNGIRVAIKQGMVNWMSVKCWYFTNDNRGYRQHSVCFNKDGRSNDWEDGFFDRWDRDLEELL